MQTKIIPKILITASHEGLHLKNHLVKFMDTKHYNYTDITNSPKEEIDLIDICSAMHKKLEDTPGGFGIIITRYGTDAAMIMNKFRGIRCAFAHTHYIAKMTREHNDANVIAFGEGIIGPDSATEMLNVFLMTEFDTYTTKNHFNRVEKLRQLEKHC